MRWRPFLWMVLSLLLFVAAAWFWRLGDQWAAEKAATKSPETNQPGPSTPAPAAPVSHAAVMGAAPIRLLSGPGLLNAKVSNVIVTNLAATPPRFAYRLSNTTKPIEQLIRQDSAVLLENALVDTAEGVSLPIPEHLRAQGDPGSYIVQSRTALDNAFRGVIAAAGASIVSYIPNNAYLVRASSAAAKELAAAPQTQAVLPYEPYFKLKGALLRAAVQRAPLPSNAELNILLFNGSRAATLKAFEDLGISLLGEERSGIGTIIRIRPTADSLAAIASLGGVQFIEMAHPRLLLNDLSRARIGVATDTQVTTNYFGLTGTNILVNINDTGVDTNHPDLIGRIALDVPASGYDTIGHGTHVAGIIAGNGTESSTLTNVSGSIMPGTNNQFRGMAPAAQLYSLPLQQSDTYLQETAAATNAFISNNSWGYDDNTYNLAAASYDAAVRDALPGVSGSQPVLFVFSAGNAGDLSTVPSDAFDGGAGGDPDTILSPGTAKNVITVGAIEQPRSITNLVTALDGTSNTVWLGMTDSSNQVAGFSSRGNVGIGVEGAAGRFKPDVVAPGTFVVSTRSSMWDEASYYNDTNYSLSTIMGAVVSSNDTYNAGVFVPDNALQLVISIYGATPSSNLVLYITPPGGAPFTATSPVSIPPAAALSPVGDFWLYSVSNASSETITFNLLTELVTTNDFGDYFEVLSNLNDSLGGPPSYYRYESGTSMAAGDVSGMLALMKEFFEQRLTPGMTNSPALMKALLINGARSVGDAYDFQVNSGINYQGWGLVNLPTTLHGGLATPGLQTNSMFLFDQNPTNALATGGSFTAKIAVSDAGRGQPLKVTLVWTDPPGDPAASIKLVNDLDLVVTNLDTGEVFLGNNILAGSDYTLAWDTNSIPTNDIINNVENVLLQSADSTNYTITVIGRRVNVNADTANPNNVVQDFALVISSGDGTVTNALSLMGTNYAFVTQPYVTVITNTFPSDPEEPTTGGLLLHQHVGANTPLLGTNTLPIPDGAQGLLTTGMTNQWHFYTISNDLDFTNAAFVTFLPPELSVPRIGVQQSSVDNATRPEADIDMYVSTNPGLTNLDPNVLAVCDRSVTRGGTEFIVYSNVAPKARYYIGIKSEDQMAAEYTFLGIFSQQPFGTTDTNGNAYLRGIPVPQVIPLGTPHAPQAAQVLALNVNPMKVRRIILTNTWQHTLPFNLLGSVTHNRKFAVLNNHTCAQDVSGVCITNFYQYIYEDNGERNVLNSRHSDGPGSLRDFVGDDGLGVWLMTMVNNFPQGTGSVGRLSMKIERQNLNPDTATFRDVQPDTWTYDEIDVPPEATNLTVCVEGNTAPVVTYVRRGAVPTITDYDYRLTNNPPGGCLEITTFDLPPLTAGPYFIGVFNPSAFVQHVRVFATLGINSSVIPSTLSSVAGNVPILDDAVTYSCLTNLTSLTIASLDVGVLINHPRISDLVITLIAPDGTRVLLQENRGGTSTNGLGTFSVTTNASGTPEFAVTNQAPFYTNDFERAAVGLYAPGAIFQDWRVLSNFVAVVPDTGIIWRSNNILVLGTGAVSNSLPTTNSTSYQLTYRVTHSPYLQGMVAWWPFDGDASDIYGGFDGAFSGDVSFRAGEVVEGFNGDGVATRMVVPACPELDLGNRPGFSIEGWVWPNNLFTNVATNVISLAAPIAEWNDLSNQLQGVQLWLGVSNSITATIWDTTQQPHFVSTPPLVLTNLGWQHVAFSYDTNSLIARIYTNGNLCIAQSVSSTNFVPSTAGDLYFGYHAARATTNSAAFLGGLDEFSVYERLLSDCEVHLIAGVTNRGKYGTNVLLCPVANVVELTVAGLSQVFAFTNGLNWTNTGLTWETNTITFTEPGSVITNGLATNVTPAIVHAPDPNATVDDFILSGLVTNYFDGLMHFTENTNLTQVPIKFAPWPFLATNFPPHLIFSNDFSFATQQVYQVGDTIAGGLNDPALGPRNWTVANGPVTVITNNNLGSVGSNVLALARGAVDCTLPTISGHRYQLTYMVHGPCAVGWWNGDTDYLNSRAQDSIGGNDGQFWYGATNAPGTNFVQTHANALFFPGVLDYTNNIGSKIELGDPDNLRLTNALTIEGWFKTLPQTNADALAALGSGHALFEQLVFRGDLRHCSDPFYLALEQSALGQYDIEFHIEEANARDCGIALESQQLAINDNEWHHIAAVFESNVYWTNNPPWPTNELRLYLDGVRLTNTIVETISGATADNTSYTYRAPFRDLDPAYSPGVTIGNRRRYDNFSPTAPPLDDDAQAGVSEPFRGFMDDLAIYGRALTAPEIAAIANSSFGGKSDPSVPPAQSLAKVGVSLDGVLVDTGYGNNSSWVTRTVSFTALRTNVVLGLQGLLPGTLIDQVTLTELPSELNYQPEQSLDILNGKQAAGTWCLEILDDRAGPPGATGELVQWQLNFRLIPSNAPPVITLSHGIPYTNTLAAGGVQNFIVPIPQWATNATNVVLSANEFRSGTPSSVAVFFDQTNQYPASTLNALFWPPVFNATNVLSTNAFSAPQLVPGPQYYFLTVSNPNPAGVTFALGVWFDILGLTNCQPQSNFVTVAGIPRYVQFDVPTNALAPNTQVEQVSFLLSGARSNLTVVLSQHLPLPDLRHYDYISSSPSTNDEIVMLLTNTSPFSIQSNRWYVGVFGNSATNIPFTVQFCYATNTPLIIPLTNGVPFTAASTDPFAAPPGPPQTFFFEFDISNSVTAVLFELYNLGGNLDLVLQQDAPPTMAAYFDGSFLTGRTPEQIVLRPSFVLPGLQRKWFLGLNNNEATNVSYTIRAVTPTNGLLISGQPLQATLGTMPAPHGLLLGWNSISGERYFVQFTPSLVPPVTWVTISAISATTPFTTIEVPSTGAGFYRIVQVIPTAPVIPPLTIQPWPGNLLRISWSVNYPGLFLQYAYSVNGPWLDVIQPVTIEGSSFVVYDPMTVRPKYYRLVP